MNQRIKVLFEEAKKLRPDDREELAELLLVSLEAGSEFEKEWGAEAQRRWDEHIASGGKTIDAFEVIEDVRRQLKCRDGT